MLFFLKLTQTGLVCLFITLSECRNSWDVVVKRKGWKPTLHVKTKGENTPYFDCVAETQNVIRRKNHDVLGALLHPVKI